ncbi:MAG: hypothetical protein NWE95_08530 [Candidatus Bathyarchaeota archaeon]|nr:hypothetical protein [Candidatus Bathyarchaeota archaeon]
MAIHRKLIWAGIILFIVLGLFSPINSSAKAENSVTFTPADKFSIPALNGSISFSVNGTCSEATLENNTWHFKDLALNNSQPLGNLKISTQDSNVTILFYRAYNATLRAVAIRYSVEGHGKQTINFGFNESQKTRPDEWSVVIPDSIFLAEGDGWNLLPDNTVVIHCVESRVSIVHYVFDYPSDEHLPFYQRHSIAIVTALVVAATIALAVLIKVKGRGLD